MRHGRFLIGGLNEVIYVKYSRQYAGYFKTSIKVAAVIMTLAF